MTRTLPALFLAALVGGVTVVGLAVTALGVTALLGYLLLLLVGLSLLVRRSRAARVPAGRTCSCCTSTVYDPVTVVEGSVR